MAVFCPTLISEHLWLGGVFDKQNRVFFPVIHLFIPRSLFLSKQSFLGLPVTLSLPLFSHISLLSPLSPPSPSLTLTPSLPLISLSSPLAPYLCLSLSLSFSLFPFYSSSF